MELALRAPSSVNTQPWQFAIVGGEKLEQIKEAYIEKSGEQPNPDFAFPIEYPEPYDSRRHALGANIFEVKGINRQDRGKRWSWYLEGLRLFGAPNVIYIYIGRPFYSQSDRLNIWPIFDCGLVAENIMLLATKYGLGTIPQGQAISYPGVLRRLLDLPDSELFVLGIAIGYPDWDDPVNQFRSEREPLDEVAKWYGFD